MYLHHEYHHSQANKNNLIIFDIIFYLKILTFGISCGYKLSRGGSFGGFSLRFCANCCVCSNNCSLVAATCPPIYILLKKNHSIKLIILTWISITKTRATRTTTTTTTITSYTIRIFIWNWYSRSIFNIKWTLNCKKIFKN